MPPFNQYACVGRMYSGSLEREHFEAVDEDPGVAALACHRLKQYPRYMLALLGVVGLMSFYSLCLLQASVLSPPS